MFKFVIDYCACQREHIFDDGNRVKGDATPLRLPFLAPSLKAGGDNSFPLTAILCSSV